MDDGLYAMKKEKFVLLQKLKAKNHAQPFKGPFTIRRVQPGNVIGNKNADTVFGPMAIIDHAEKVKGRNHKAIAKI